MQEKNTWNLIKKIGTVKKIDEGGDSTVYSINDDKTGEILGVAKNYDNLSGGFAGLNNPELTKKILSKYHQDTEKAFRMLEKDPNPLKQSMEINGENYLFKYKIVQQGDFMLAQRRKSSFSETEEEVPSLVGQEYVKGLNFELLVKMPRGAIPSEGQEIFAKNYDLYKKLEEMIKKFLIYLSETVGASFSFGAMNIKPFVNPRERSIDIIITDLSANIRSDYHKIRKL